MKELEQKIKSYLAERKWDNLRPGDLAKSISIESGELLELFQWNNPTLEEVKNNPEKLAEVKKELADVLLYCLDLSVSLELDTEQVVLDKLAKIEKKYPAELFQNSTQEPGTEDIYWKIKKEHRKKENS